MAFPNCLPLAVTELKRAATKHGTIKSVFAQLQTHIAQLPTLFHANGILAVPDGRTEAERAFNGALARNRIPEEIMGHDGLRVVAQELLNRMKQNATVDWHRKERALARMRALVRLTLKKFGYPPIWNTRPCAS